MANTFRGVGVHWGVGSTTFTACGTIKLQSRDHSKRSDIDEVRDADGAVVQKTYYNFNEEASFDMVVSGASGGAITPTLPDIGAIITVTDTTYTQIAGTNWLVDDVSTTTSNTSAMRVTLRLTKYPGITA